MRAASEKMGIRPGTRAHIIGATPEVLNALALPRLTLTEQLEGGYGYLHLFVTAPQQMEELFPALRNHLCAGAMLCVSWPKGRKLGTELTLPKVIGIGYSHGLVESKTIAVDSTWSAIKFTHPRPGQQYNNSYGTLPNSLDRLEGHTDATNASRDLGNKINELNTITKNVQRTPPSSGQRHTRRLTP